MTNGKWIPLQVQTRDSRILVDLSCFWFSALREFSPRCLIPGNCRPHYIRSTMYNLPCTNDIIKQCHIPMALTITPFARIDEKEVSDVTLVNMTSNTSWRQIFHDVRNIMTSKMSWSRHILWRLKFHDVRYFMTSDMYYDVIQRHSTCVADVGGIILHNAVFYRGSHNPLNVRVVSPVAKLPASVHVFIIAASPVGESGGVGTSPL